MADRLTKEQRRRNMQRIRSRDTSIELVLRKAIWHKGIRYRKNWKGIPGKPDIAITKYKIAVFCDSSFWHGRDYDNSVKPQTNAEFWEKKIRRNIERDKEVNKTLNERGWTVLRFWDNEIIKNTDSCVNSIIDAVERAKCTKNSNCGTK